MLTNEQIDFALKRLEQGVVVEASRLAEDIHGKSCEPDDPTACRWCVIGAFPPSAFNDCDAVTNAFREKHGMNPTGFLRTHTPAEVIAAVRALKTPEPALT